MLLEQLRKRFGRSQGLYFDFVTSLEESYLVRNLCDLPSNSIGQQLWCVIGARTSYIKATSANEWQGFECHLAWEKTTSKDEVLKQLQNSYENIREYLDSLDGLEEVKENFLLDLLEHEVQHHGQLARYIYGHKLQMPTSWKERYNFD